MAEVARAKAVTWLVSRSPPLLKRVDVFFLGTCVFDRVIPLNTEIYLTELRLNELSRTLGLWIESARTKIV